MSEPVQLPNVRLRRETLEVQILRWLRDAILTGQLVRGTRLVQSDLAKQLGTSRIPVRDALRRLEADGLVRVADERGTFVVRGLAAEDVEEIYDIRLRLEGLATERAALCMDEEERSALAALVERMQVAARRADLKRYGELDHDFHLAIYEGSRCLRLTRAITGLLAGIPPLAPISLKGRVREAHREHMAVFEAIMARDGAAAEAAAEHHVAQARRALLHGLRPVTQAAS